MNDFYTFQNDNDFMNDFDSGLGKLMMTKVGAVNIQPQGCITAFKRFLDKNRVGKEFYIADLVGLYQKELLKKQVVGRAGEAIIAVSGSIAAGALQKNILSSSVCGIYELILRTRGFALDLTQSEYDDLAFTRFYFCKQSRAQIMASEMIRNGLSARVIGMAGCEDRISIVVDGVTKVDVVKQQFVGSEPVTLNVGEEYAEYFTRSVGETAFYAPLYATGYAKYIDVGHRGDAESLFASLLGVYAAQFNFGIPGCTQRYHKGYTVAVRKQFVAERGTYVTLFDAKDSATGAVNAQSVQRTMQILRSYASEGLICGVLPVRGDIDTSIGQLADGAVFVRYQNCPLSASTGSVLVLSRRMIGGIRIGEIK